MSKPRAHAKSSDVGDKIREVMPYDRLVTAEYVMSVVEYAGLLFITPEPRVRMSQQWTMPSIEAAENSLCD